MRGIPLTDTPVEDGADYVASNTSIGSEYVKALFKGYTDDTFTNRSIQVSSPNLIMKTSSPTD
jgi:hypothetical protein